MTESLLDRYQKHLDKVKGSIFSQPWWWEATTGTQDLSLSISESKTGSIQAALPYYRGSKAAVISWIRMPPLTPYLEISISQKEGKPTTQERFREKCIEDIISTLPAAQYLNILLHPDTPVINWGALGLKSKLEVTYSLQNIKDHDFTFSQFESRARNAIRNAEDKLSIRPATISELYNLLEMTFAKQNLKSPVKFSFLSQLVESLGKKGSHLMLCAVDAKENVHAANLTVFDHGTAYNLLMGSNPQLHQSGAVPYLLWQTICQVATSVNTFDFEGGMIPGIASLYRSLGGEKKPYVRLFGSTNRMLESAFILLGKF